jgi:hypothetical protein
MSLKRFTNPKNLRGLGRKLLTDFFGKFTEELKKCQVVFPLESFDDDKYFKQLAAIFMSPKLLPGEMTDVLYAVVEMANEQGVERLTKAAKDKGVSIDWEQKASDLDIVMQLWLADRSLVDEQHGEFRLTRMTSFQYWGPKPQEGNRVPISPVTKEVIELLQKDVDDWCKENHRGENTVTITKHEIDGEWWFLIQHGGIMSRLPKIEDRKTEILFFRPGKDDVVVYNVDRDEIRIHANTKGEKELYKSEFGRRLRGDTDYFSERKNFVLDPLRTDIEFALDPEGLPDISKIILKEIEIGYGGEFDDRYIRKSDDIVLSAAQRAKDGKLNSVVPEKGQLRRATFEIQFANSKKPRKVYLRPPDELRVGRHGDLKAVHAWLNERNFRTSTAE